MPQSCPSTTDRCFGNGPLLDSAALELAREAPSTSLELVTREAGEVLTSRWQEIPKRQKQLAWCWLAVLSSLHGLSKLRILWSGGQRPRQDAYEISTGFDPAHRCAISRRGGIKSEAMMSDLLDLISLQVQGILGVSDTDDKAEFVYGFFVGRNRYVGRTGAVQKRGEAYSATLNRYTQHARLLWRHFSGDVAKISRRTRYKKLLQGTQSLFADFYVFRYVECSLAQTWETQTVVSTKANANSLLWLPGLVSGRQRRNVACPARVRQKPRRRRPLGIRRRAPELRTLSSASSSPLCTAASSLTIAVGAMTLRSRRNLMGNCLKPPVCGAARTSTPRLSPRPRCGLPYVWLQPILPEPAGANGYGGGVSGPTS